MKGRIVIVTKSRESFFGDPYEIDFNDTKRIWMDLYNRRYTMQEMMEVIKVLYTHDISCDDMLDWFVLKVESEE